MFNKRKKELAKRKRELENKKQKQNQQNAKAKEAHQKAVNNKRPPQLAVTVLLDSKTGTVSVATNFESLPLTRGMLEQATDNVRQINTLRLNHLDKIAAQHEARQEAHRQHIADAKSDKENKEAMHKQMRNNE